jgi:hypothetical protein
LHLVRVNQRHAATRRQTVIALILVATVLLLDAMAASPALHEWIHADAGAPDHQCAVTLFAHGQVHAASVAVPLPAPLSFIVTTPCCVFVAFRPAIEDLPAGRGPPALPAVS